MKGKLWFGFILLIAILFFGAYKLLSIHGDKEPEPITATVERGEIVIGIKEIGILKALRSSSVAVPRMRAWYGDMKVTKLVPEGTQVKKDDPLVWLSSQELEKRLNIIGMNEYALKGYFLKALLLEAIENREEKLLRKQQLQEVAENTKKGSE